VSPADEQAGTGTCVIINLPRYQDDDDGIINRDI
jgi:hypothetical protein